MRFGFLFFAEYVNVFIVSALMVTLFFGSWNAPVDIAALLDAINNVFGTDLQPLAVSLDPGSLGIGLLILLAVVPVALTLLFALPFYLTRSSMPAWQALLDRVPPVQRRGRSAPRSRWPGSAGTGSPGMVWFMIKSFVFVFVFVWMRGDLPARPDRPPDGLRLEVAAARRRCSTCSSPPRRSSWSSRSKP